MGPARAAGSPVVSGYTGFTVGRMTCAGLWVATLAKLAFFIIAIFWRARSRLYQNEILQQSMRLTAFFKLYKMCTLLHRSKLNASAKILQMSLNLKKFAKFQEFQLDNLVAFEKCCKTRIFLQRSVPIQPKTSKILPKFCQKLATTLWVPSALWSTCLAAERHLLPPEALEEPLDLRGGRNGAF